MLTGKSTMHLNTDPQVKQKRKTYLYKAFLLILVLPVFAPARAQVESCNVIWDSSSRDSWGSMPAGNGDIGANVWVNPDGEIHFYISKTDAFSENGRLLKIGKPYACADP